MTTAVARPGLHKPDDEDENRLLFKDRVFATQEYIPWFIGSLRLGNKIDLSRVRNDQVKVLVGHNGSNPVGRVIRARHDRQAGVFRSDFEIPKNSATENVRQLIASDLMRDISVGARLVWASITLDNEDDIEEWEDIDDARWTAHEWQYVEQSLTPIPADVNAGLDRQEIGDLLREDDDIVILRNGDAIMHSALEDKHRSQFLDMIEKRRNPMTTPPVTEDVVQAMVAKELARREAENADAILQRQNQTIEELRKQGESYAGAIATLETARAQAEKDAQDASTYAAEVRNTISALEASLREEREARDAESKINAEYRQKLDTIQFRPGGQVLQLSNWNVGDRVLSLGNLLKLTWEGTKAADSPLIDPSKVTLEESYLEIRQSELDAQAVRHPMSQNVCAQIPFSAIAERERQIDLIRNSNMASGAGVRGLEVTVLPGDGGLVMARYAPILAGMNIAIGVVGEQRLGYFSANPGAATNPANPIAEGANLTAGTWTMAGTAKQPHTIQMPFQMTTSLKSIDDGTFERLVNQSIFELLYNVLTAQVLAGNGTAPNLQGIWSQASLPNVNYGAGAANFDRDDVLDLLNSVRLSNTVGGGTIAVLSEGLWKLAEKTPRAVDGTSSAGYTEIQKFVLDDIQYTDAGVMGFMEGAPTFYYSDLAPSGITNPGLALKASRCQIWIWGDSINMEYVPTMAANWSYRTVVEANCDFEHPTKNMARIKQT